MMLISLHEAEPKLLPVLGICESVSRDVNKPHLVQFTARFTSTCMQASSLSSCVFSATYGCHLRLHRCSSEDMT